LRILGRKSLDSQPPQQKRDLFEIGEEGEALRDNKKGVFHSVSKRGRLDIQLTIAFLCTRISCSTEQDWGKLRRLIE
jgi:hypothetical protein